MARILDIQQFVKDYCQPLSDKDLIIKYQISAKELIPLVRKLITEGFITREHHQERTRKMKQKEVVQEKSFLKSLYHCPVCSHIHPTPFEVCPACGTSIADPKRPQQPQPRPTAPQQRAVNRPAVPQAPQRAKPAPAPQQQSVKFLDDDEMALDSPRPIARKAPPPARPAPQPKPEPKPEPRPQPKPEPRPQPKPKAEPEPRPQPKPKAEPEPRPKPKPKAEPEPRPKPAPKPKVEEFPAELKKRIGKVIQNTTQYTDLPSGIAIEGYKLTDVVGNTPRAATYKAENPSGYGPVLAAKLFHKEIAEDADINEVLDQIVEFQSNMDNLNIVHLIGEGVIGSERFLVYEYLPLSLETVIQKYPDGMPEELIERLLPQILNGLGYMHTHRGKDGVTRRLHHLNIKPSKILIDANIEIAKLDDCGVSKALFEVRGWKKHLYEEPGADLTTLAPEAFVLRGRTIKAVPLDIYSIGCLMYRMGVGKFPFEGEDLEELKFAHLRKYATPPRVHKYDIALWLDEMIMKCLEKESEERWRSPTEMELSIGKQLKKKTKK